MIAHRCRSGLGRLGASSLALVTCVGLGCAETRRPDGGTGLLPVGTMAPDVTGVDQNGAAQRLRDAIGRPTVVYFYPRDGTPGCTKEACAFRDVWQQYQQEDVRLFGVSSNDRDSHRDFADRHQLPFPLIADESQTWAKAFGVSSHLGLYQRVSFLIAPDGRVAKSYPDVDPGVHAAQVLADAKALAP
jgi:thioredoxin-dependent peroxiredoxin